MDSIDLSNWNIDAVYYDGEWLDEDDAELLMEALSDG